MHLLYTSQTQLFLLSYRAHALSANVPFELTRRLWPSCHSDLGGSRHGWGFPLKTKWYSLILMNSKITGVKTAQSVSLFSNQIKSKVLVFGAVSTTINDQGCQHVTGKFESIRMPLNKSAGWPTFVQSHLSIKTVEWFKTQLPLILPTYRKGEN